MSEAIGWFSSASVNGKDEYEHHVSVPFGTGLILFLTSWLEGASRARGLNFIAELFQLFTSE